jgi:hypothetical protein
MVARTPNYDILIIGNFEGDFVYECYAAESRTRRFYQEKFRENCIPILATRINLKGQDIVSITGENFAGKTVGDPFLQGYLEWLRREKIEGEEVQNGLDLLCNGFNAGESESEKVGLVRLK